MKRVILIALLAPLSSALAEDRAVVWNADVLRLFLLQERDAALQKILSEARYPKDAAYTEEQAGEIKQVVICPQPDKPPLVAIFTRSTFEPDDVSPRSGRLILIRSDATILPFYRGANYLDGHFRDLNGDGVIDYVKSWGFRYGDSSVTSLHVIPIQEPFGPSLVIHWKSGSFTWRCHQPDLGRTPAIQIGTEEGGKFAVAAEYRWSPTDVRWVGPKGSRQAGFLFEMDRLRAASQLIGTPSEN